jgi:hypothetical protein
MHYTLLLLDCVAILAILISSHVCAYTFGQHRGWKEIWRTYDQYAKEGVTLSEGETLVGVVEIKKGQYFFIGLNTKDRALRCSSAITTGVISAQWPTRCSRPGVQHTQVNPVLHHWSIA